MNNATSDDAAKTAAEERPFGDAEPDSPTGWMPPLEVALQPAPDPTVRLARAQMTPTKADRAALAVVHALSQNDGPTTGPEMETAAIRHLRDSGRLGHDDEPYVIRRVQYACTYLKSAGLAQQPDVLMWELTPHGRDMPEESERFAAVRDARLGYERRARKNSREAKERQHQESQKRAEEQAQKESWKELMAGIGQRLERELSEAQYALAQQRSKFRDAEERARTAQEEYDRHQTVLSQSNLLKDTPAGSSGSGPYR